MRLITYNPFFTSRWKNNFDSDVFPSPSVNITEKDNGFFIDIVSPGLNKEDFKIELQKNQLTIAVEKKQNTEQKENDKVWQREYGMASFSRSFHLPETVEGDAIEANYDQGILKLFIPKKAEVIPTKKTIEVV
ncbi:MAG: Hsp20/alpha crystallin family protein [Saprospiraceae bacterium]